MSDNPNEFTYVLIFFCSSITLMFFTVLFTTDDKKEFLVGIVKTILSFIICAAISLPAGFLFRYLIDHAFKS